MSAFNRRFLPLEFMGVPVPAVVMLIVTLLALALAVLMRHAVWSTVFGIVAGLCLIGGVAIALIGADRLAMRHLWLTAWREERLYTVESCEGD